MARSKRRTDSFDEDFDDLFADSYLAALDVLGDDQEAEDVAVEAMARAYARWPRLRRRGWRSNWVVMTAQDLAFDVVAAVPSGAVDEEQVEALARLPRREREVIALRDLAGLSTRECAEVLRVGERTISRIEGRGRSRLTGADTPGTPGTRGSDQVDPGDG